MRIADITDADIPAVVRLWQACGLTRPWNDPHADIALARRTADATVLVGRDDAGAVTATAMVGFDGHRAWVYYVAVDPAHQGRGRGRAIMAAAESWARARGAPKLELMVREGNAAAQAFYQRLGYAIAPVAVLARWIDGR